MAKLHMNETVKWKWNTSKKSRKVKNNHKLDCKNRAVRNVRKTYGGFLTITESKREELKAGAVHSCISVPADYEVRQN